jgi:signal transduction protein with GAF and PtsI domain
VESSADFFRGRNQIKTKSVFATIREISEILSFSNEPDKLANMALDTLSRVLDIECCWIQTINDRKHKKLLLAAERGFSPEMRLEIASMDMSHSFSEQIIGLGHKIIIPDLSNDGRYGLPSFRDTGLKWLVAVPLMTYRVHGILGTASRNRKRLHKDTADLIMVIAGLIAASISKTYLARKSPEPEKPDVAPTGLAKEDPIAPDKKPGEPVNIMAGGNEPPHKTPGRPDGAFHSHASKMEKFRRSHR